ncbi:MAG TPA: hypothetical protein PK402_13655 [Tepidisphaeraceae bacterium]|nr:hypothetical protein [Tepidisphaeraceae bacterium]
MSEDQPNSIPVSPLFVMTCLLAFVVGGIALRIEILNAQVGFYLPRGPDDVGKWRVSPINDDFIRRYMRLVDADGNTLTRELSGPEKVQAQAIAKKEKANSELRAWVGSAGLLQYLLLPALMISTLISFASKPSNKAAAVLILIMIVNVGAAISLFYRDYLGSLGW